MGSVFISYRREDSSGSARGIYDRLARRLGRKNIFFDVDSIPPGVDFVELLTERVSSCDALVAVIGADWISSVDRNNQRRIDNPRDFVRIEIEAALDRNIRVIPVLVDGATMPMLEDLPESLRKLARLQGIEITHIRFDADVKRLIRTLTLFEEERRAAEAERAAREERERQEAHSAVRAKVKVEGIGREERGRKEAVDVPRAEEVQRLVEIEAPRREGAQPAEETADAERAAREELGRQEGAEPARIVGPTPDVPTPSTSARPQPILKMTGISKRFPGVRALEDVHLEVGRPEIHALLGENGAGKSTLLKVLSGAHAADAGTIELFGKEVSFETPHDAQRAGVVTIYQEFTLAPDMTIAENVFIGREPGSRLFVSWRRLADDTRAITERIGLKRDPMTPVRDLSVAEQQLVEIARALSMQSRLIVMDEPTSALSEAEVANLARIIRALKAEGLSIIFVTHRLEEVFRLCDRYTVLRDGHYVGAGNVADTNADAIIRMMVGREVSALYGHPPALSRGAVALEVIGLTRRRDARDPHAIELVDVSFRAHHGEILGLAGLVGAGRTETARAIFGADPFDHGEIFVDGKPVIFSGPRDAMAHGVGLVPEDRKKQALFLRLAIRTNITIAAQDQISRGWFIDEKREVKLIDEFRRLLSIRMASPDQEAGLLSGGNQQKVVLARWLALRPKILIVDEPTRGIDVGSKVEVHNLLIDMAKSGIAIIVISSELPEILAVCDRIITMREGRVTGEIARADATQEVLMAMMTAHERAGEPLAAA